MARDPRANIRGRVKAAYNVDNSKLNKTDAIIYQKYPYNNQCVYLYHGTYDILEKIKADDIAIVSHESLYYDLEKTMRSLSSWLNVKFNDSMLTMTFSGQKWWGDEVYDMGRLNSINPRVVSTKWKSDLSLIEWFVIEGLSYQLMSKHGYKTEKYKKDSIKNLLLLFFVYIITI